MKESYTFDKMREKAIIYHKGLTSDELTHYVTAVSNVMHSLNRYCICDSIERFESSIILAPSDCYVDKELSNHVASILALTPNSSVDDFIDIIDRIEKRNNELSEINT